MRAEPAAKSADAAVDLVIVSSPLQYINAVEQRAAAGDRPADLILIGDRHGGEAAISALMRRHAPWRAVYRHAKRPRPPIGLPRLMKDALDAGHRTSLRRLARRLSPTAYSSVVIGDYRNVSERLLADLVPHDSFVLLDDGSVTPQAAAFRAKAGRAPEPRQFDLGWFRTPIARHLFGDPTLVEPENVTFFTIYGRLLANRMKPGDAIIDNGYRVWRSGAGVGPRGGATWLLGSDHAEAGICTGETYRRVILAGVAALRAEGVGPILYRPHRGEARAKVESLAQDAEMSLDGSSAPVELDCLDAATRPARVAVIASSAADTLSVIDPELDIVRFALPEDYLQKRADHIRAVVAAHHAFNPRLRTIGTGTEGRLLENAGP